MRPLIVFSTVTVDGFMAGPNNDLDFMVQDPLLEEEFTAQLMRVADLNVVGRASFGPMGAFWSAERGAIADWMNATPKVVLSSQEGLEVGSWENSTAAAGDGVEHVRRLKASEGGSLVTFGGVHTVRSLVSANLVDEYWLKVNPAVVGRGRSMFSDIAQTRALTLRSATTYPSGTIAAVYTTPQSAPARAL